MYRNDFAAGAAWMITALLARVSTGRAYSAVEQWVLALCAKHGALLYR